MEWILSGQGLSRTRQRNREFTERGDGKEPAGHAGNEHPGGLPRPVLSPECPGPTTSLYPLHRKPQSTLS
jgi:hypothetical protein